MNCMSRRRNKFIPGIRSSDLRRRAASRRNDDGIEIMLFLAGRGEGKSFFSRGDRIDFSVEPDIDVSFFQFIRKD